MNRKPYCRWLATPTAGIVKMLLAGQQVLWIATCHRSPNFQEGLLPLTFTAISRWDCRAFVALLTFGVVWGEPRGYSFSANRIPPSTTAKDLV